MTRKHTNNQNLDAFLWVQLNSYINRTEDRLDKRMNKNDIEKDKRMNKKELEKSLKSHFPKMSKEAQKYIVLFAEPLSEFMPGCVNCGEPTWTDAFRYCIACCEKSERTEVHGESMCKCTADFVRTSLEDGCSIEYGDYE